MQLLFQQIRHHHHRDVGVSLKGPVQTQSAAFMQVSLPPVCRDEFRQNDGNKRIRPLAVDSLYVCEKGTNERAKRRLDHDQL